MAGALPRADVGVFGGSGFYRFLDDVTEVVVDTPYGPTSAPIHLGALGERSVAFLPRTRSATRRIFCAEIGMSLEIETAA